MERLLSSERHDRANGVRLQEAPWRVRRYSPRPIPLAG